jgi:hypothetical protein
MRCKKDIAHAAIASSGIMPTMKRVSAAGMPLPWARGWMTWRIGRKPAPKMVAVKEHAMQIAAQ